MKRTTRTDMSIKWMRVLARLRAGDQVADDTARSIAMVEADRDHSEDFKRRQADQLRKEAGQEYERLGREVYALLDDLDTQELEMSATVDYADPRLFQGLSLVKLLGGGFPNAGQERMIEDYRGDPFALRCIQSAFKSAGLDCNDVTEALSRFEDLTTRDAEAAGELLAYATTDYGAREWRSGPVREMARRAQAAYGLDLDSPIVHELEHIRDTTGDKAKAARVDRWIKAHGGSVHEDAGAGGPTDLGVEVLLDFRAGEGDEGAR